MTHFFDAAVAEEVGVNAAIIFQNIYYWCEKNRANDDNFFDGKYWTYSSIEAFGKLFPYLTIRNIRTAVEKLKDSGLIVIGRFNKSSYDRTLWYAITEKGYSILLYRNIHLSEMTNEIAAIDEPIPNINKDNNTYRGVFTPPTLDEVKAYCTERKNGIDPERFVNFYEAKGWMIGKNKMKDWKAAIRTWEKDAQYAYRPKTGEKELSFNPREIELRAIMETPEL